MGRVDPIPNQPAAIAALADERLLIVADYHAGFEAGMRQEHGMEVPSQAPARRDRLTALVEQERPDRLVILGDLLHSIGGPGGAERAELEVLFEAIDRPVTLVKGNHDGVVEEMLQSDPTRFGNIEVTPSDGHRIGAVGFAHGHTWPAAEVLDVDVLCIGHEHPRVRLTDQVGGSRVKRVWLRGPVSLAGFDAQLDERPDVAPTLVVLPAFNELCGGTWINVPEQSFLAPFLPAGLASGDAYLLDGTNLGPYQEV